MIATEKDMARGEALLKKVQVNRTDVSAFRFMERHREKTPSGEVKKETYGAGVLTLMLKDGAERVLVLRPRNKPSSIIRYLISCGIPFENLKTLQPATFGAEKKNYHRPSIYMFWFFLLFITAMILGYHLLNPNNAWSALPALLLFGVALYLISMLLTRFCYLTLKDNELVIHSVGRSIHYPYAKLLKINFEFAREISFTHVMEVLDKDYRYRLFYIGRTSRKSLKEITERLQHAGVDATCSLNPAKRFYEDKHLYQ
ncbi:MAG: hypothetical protein J6C87_06365 [Bacteroides sp.]|nr:hypothetical protein [Bacteroides sp.]